MNDNDLSLRFGADVSGVEAGAEAVQAELGGLRGSVQTLVDAFMVLGGAASGSFREMRSGALEAHEQVKGLSESVVEMREMIVGLGEALIAAFAVEQIFEFAKKMGEAGEQIEHTGLALGMTIEEVQGLQAMANATGMSLEGVTGAAQRLERALAAAHSTSTSVNRQAAAFKQLGVDINEARTPAELFNEVVAKFADMPPSLDKSQEAMALFGRNITEVAPLLGLTKDQLAEVTRQTQLYGLQNTEAVAQAAALGERFNENRNAMQGVSNVLAQAFAPSLGAVVQGMNDLAAAFIHSYNEGGAAKIILESLDVVFKVVVATVHTLAVGFLELWHVAVGAIEAIIAPVYALGGALDAVLRGKGISGGVDAFKQQMADMDSAAVGHFRAAQQAGEDYLSFEQRLWSGQRAQSEDTPPIRTLGEGQGTGRGQQGEDALNKLREKFEEWENAHNSMIRDMTADELQFWKNVEAGAEMGTLNAKQQAEVRLTVGRLEHQEAMAQIKDQIEAAKDAAQQTIATIRDEEAERSASIQRQISAVQAAAQRHEITYGQASQKIIALYNEERDAAIQAAQQIYAARVAADNFVMAHAMATTAEYRAAMKDEIAANAERNKAIVAATAQANRQIQADEQRTLEQIRQQWRTNLDGIVSSFTSGMAGMITGAQTFQQAMLSVAQSVENALLKAVDNWLTSWLVNMIVGKEQQSATAMAQVQSNAAVAASAAFASTAAIPVFGPELAPGAAEAAYMADMGWMSLASAAGGWGDVPYDGAPTLLHKREMVLPATIATPLRQMVSGGGGVGPAANGGAGPMGGGVTHTHNWNINVADGPSFMRLMENHSGALKRLAERQARNMAA